MTRLYIKILSLFLVLPFTQTIFAQKKIVPSHTINGDWNEYFRFVVNEGANAENFEELLFKEILNLKNVKKIAGFESAKKTRFVLSTYQLEHRSVVDFVKKATAAGHKFLFTVDGNLLEEFKPLTDKQIAKLTDGQKDYYYRTYNLDKSSSKVTNKDAEIFNSKYKITRWCWSELEKIQEKSPGSITLISSPAETVPGVGMNFPRIHHWKEYSIQFYQDGKWVDVKSFIPSSNLTNTCLNHEKGRISSSYANELRYMREQQTQWDKALREKKITQNSYDSFVAANEKEKYRIAFAKTVNHPVTGIPLRSGHIQFGQIFTDEYLLNIFKGDPIKKWGEQYKKGKLFDHALPRRSHLPEVIFEDQKRNTFSRLRAYYSEGIRSLKADSDFVSTAYNSIFSDPGNSIRVFKSSQFVTTHPRVINKITKAMSAVEFEELFMVVDGNFSTETYSALPRLASSSINDGSFTPWTKAMVDSPLNQEQKLKALNSLYSFDGHKGIYGGKDGVKLHAKMSYIEYVDSHNVRHYVVIHGSGNLSVNAGKGNADGLILFDTTDSRLKDQIIPYFEGLKNNVRTQPFLETLLQKRLSHMVVYNAKSLKEVQANGFESSKEARFIEKNIELLKINGGKLTTEFASLIKGQFSLEQEKTQLLKIASVLTKESNQSAFGKNFVKILRFYSQLGSHFGFDQLQQALYLANPQEHPYQGLLRRVEFDWLKRLSSDDKPRLAKKLKSLFKRLARFDNDHQSILLSEIEREVNNGCSSHYKNLGLNDFKRIQKKTGNKK